MLVRIAALVAVDAPPISHALNLEAASDLDIDPDQVRGVLAAIAPIVGTARIASATETSLRLSRSPSRPQNSTRDARASKHPRPARPARDGPGTSGD
jgi:hypothetical protein